MIDSLDYGFYVLGSCPPAGPSLGQQRRRFIVNVLPRVRAVVAVPLGLVLRSKRAARAVSPLPALAASSCKTPRR